MVVASVPDQFTAVEAELTARIATLDAEIAAMLRDGAWAESAVLLQTIGALAPRRRRGC